MFPAQFTFLPPPLRKNRNFLFLFFLLEGIAHLLHLLLFEVGGSCPNFSFYLCLAGQMLEAHFSQVNSPLAPNAMAAGNAQIAGEGAKPSQQKVCAGYHCTHSTSECFQLHFRCVELPLPPAKRLWVREKQSITLLESRKHIMFINKEHGLHTFYYYWP